MAEPTRYLSQLAAATELGVHKQTIYLRRKDGEFPDPDVQIGDRAVGWSHERIKKYAERSHKEWVEAIQTKKLPAWWHVSTRQYMSYSEVAAALGWRQNYIWIKAGRGQILQPQVVIGELNPAGTPRESTGLVRGETAGFTESKVVEFGQQEGRLDADGNLIAKPKRRGSTSSTKPTQAS